AWMRRRWARSRPLGRYGWPRSSALLLEQRVDELVGVERDEVVDRLAEADQLDRYAQVGLDRERDAALGGAVELGQHDATDLDGLGELLGLYEAVLPGRRIEDEQHLGDLAGRLVGHAADLAQLLHEVDLRVQPAGGVGQHQVVPASRGPFDGVEHDRARVAARGAAHDLGAGARGPGLELLGRGGAKGVRRRHQHVATLRCLLPADLADGRRLADAVDADEQPHVRRAGLEPQGAVDAGETLLQVVLQRVDQRVGRRDAVALDA